MKRTIFIFALTLATSSFCKSEPSTNVSASSIYYNAGRYGAYALGSIIAAKAAPGALTCGAFVLTGQVVADGVLRYGRLDQESSHYYAERILDLFVGLGITTGISITAGSYLKNRTALSSAQSNVGISLYQEQISLKSAVLTGLSIRLVMDLLGIPNLKFAYSKIKDGYYQTKEIIS